MEIRSSAVRYPGWKNTILDGKYEFLKPYYDMVLAEQEDGVCQDYVNLKDQRPHYSGALPGRLSVATEVAMMNMGTWFISTLIEKIKTGEYTDYKLGNCKVSSC